MRLFPTGDAWTVADLDRIHHSVRVEVHGGALVVHPHPPLWRADTRHRLCNVLLRAGRHAFTQVGVYGRPNDTRVAEVGVFDEEPDDLDASWHDPAALALVAEVWSPSSDGKDRNPDWYLEHRIPEYWLAEPIEGEKADALVTMCRRGRNLAGRTEYVRYRQSRLSELERDGL